MLCDGNGSVLVIPGFSADILQIGSARSSHNKIDRTKLSDVDEKSCPSKLRNFDPREVQLYWDPKSEPPIGQSPVTITISYPVDTEAGHTTPTIKTFTGWLSEKTTPVLANGQNMIGSFSIQPTSREATTNGG